MMKEKENGQIDPKERVYRMVKTFCENEGLKTVEKHLMDVITSTDEWINRCPQRKIAERICALCELYQFVQKLGEYVNEREEADNGVHVE
ncbi:hypothetical protein [Butyricimonas faecihominis]|jgi:hypothetical protein